MILAAQLFLCIVKVRSRTTIRASVYKFLYFTGKSAVFTGMLCLPVGSGYVGILDTGIKDFFRMKQFSLSEILLSTTYALLHILLCDPVRGPISQVPIHNVGGPDIDAVFRKPVLVKCFGYKCHSLCVLSVVVIIVIIIVIIVGRRAAASCRAGGWHIMGNHLEYCL